MLRKTVLLFAGLMLLLSVPAQASVIDTSRTGTIELNFLHPNPHNDVPGHSADGVGARVQRASELDLSATEGWRAAAVLGIQDVLAWEDLAFDVDRTGHSDNRGILTFTVLPLGLYLVTALEDGTFDPFVVTVPLPSGAGEWDYAIEVYPKISQHSTVLGPPGDAGEKDHSGPSAIPPSDSDVSDLSGSTAGRGALASTGASVIGLVGAGFLLLFIGAYLIVRKRQGEDHE